MWEQNKQTDKWKLIASLYALNTDGLFSLHLLTNFMGESSPAVDLVGLYLYKKAHFF